MIKQIDKNKALELEAKGIEVMVLAPMVSEPKEWTDYCPDTLDHILDGCMFFRQEPAMETGLMEELTNEPSPPPQEEKTPVKKKAKVSSGSKLQVDTGKIMALRKAGWSYEKIADEMRISVGTVHRYAKMMEVQDGKED